MQGALSPPSEGCPQGGVGLFSNHKNLMVTNPTDNNGGNSNYAKEDESNNNSVQYYRIKTLNSDLSVKYSEAIKVNAVKRKGSVVIYPNPVQGKILNLIFTAMPKGQYQYIVSNNIGQQILSGNIVVGEVRSKYSIILPTYIPAQNCILTLIDEMNLKTVIAFKMVD